MAETNGNENVNVGIEIKEGEFGQIELPQLDVSQYIGKKVKIEKIEKREGSYGYFLRIITEAVEILNNGNEIRATKIFGLQQNEEGVWGFGPETKLGKFLKKKGISDPAQLKDIEVVCQTVTGNDGKDYLTFN